MEPGPRGRRRILALQVLFDQPRSEFGLENPARHPGYGLVLGKVAQNQRPELTSQSKFIKFSCYLTSYAQFSKFTNFLSVVRYCLLCYSTMFCGMENAVSAGQPLVMNAACAKAGPV